MRKLLSSAAAAAVLLAGCVSNDNASGKGGSSGAQRLGVTIADDKCDVSAEKTESGRVVFTLKNEGTVKNEFEILAPDKLRIVGERENLAPGTTVKYTVVLEPGSYYTACKKNMVGALVGAKKFTVSDSGKKVEASGDEKKLQEQAVSNYNAYNRDQAGQLLEKTKAFAEAYKAGDLDKARSLYAATRQHYERIEPTAEKFGDLDPALDEREADWQETEDKDTRAWKGWHYIEKDLWRPDGFEGLNDEQSAKDFSIKLADISNGAINLLEEVATTKITGEEEAFSHTDLWDFQANVEGAKVAYGNVEAIAKKKDPALAKEISKRFDQLQAELDKYKQGDGYVYYDKLNEDQRKQLSNSVNALRKPLAKLTEAILKDAGESTSKK